MSSQHGILFVLSAPSGTGKSTLARELIRRVPGLAFSVSHTTRPMRAGERDGADYHFVERAQFVAMIEDGRFLEWADVFGQLYGTGLDRTRGVLEEGQDLLLDIDVQGARQVRESTVPAVTIMLLPPSFATLEARLRRRASEAPDELRQRLAQARREAEQYPEFDYLVINDALDDTVGELSSIVRAERRRSARCDSQAARIIASFPG